VTCREAIEFLLGYLEGTLPAAERVRFEEHLAECPDCVGYLATYQATIRLGQAAYRDSDDGTASDIPEDLVRAILAARAGRSR
jgi:anti-sigma factor RsiW